jgi:hypothetical protein
MDKQQATQEIREILEGIRDGRLEHNQRWFFCGTARCVAGWKVALDYMKENPDAPKEVDEETLYEYAECSLEDPYDGCLQSPWKYAMERWGLSEEDADELFDEGATIAGQFAVLERLEEENSTQN